MAISDEPWHMKYVQVRLCAMTLVLLEVIT